jgi:hypothetical protein
MKRSGCPPKADNPDAELGCATVQMLPSAISRITTPARFVLREPEILSQGGRQTAVIPGCDWSRFSK